MPSPPLRSPRPRWRATVIAVVLALGSASVGSIRSRDASADDTACQGLIAAASAALDESARKHDPARARDALGYADRAARLCPNNIDIPFIEALAQHQLQNLPGLLAAREKCERIATAQVLEHDRPRSDAANESHVLYLQALVHDKYGDKPGEAVTKLTLLARRDPGFRPEGVRALLFRSLLDLSAQLIRFEDFEGAITQARAARAAAGVEPLRRDEASLRLAKALYAGNHYSEAQPLLEELALRFPRDAGISFDLAGVHADQLHFEKAVDVWKETIRLLALPDVDPKLVELLSDAPMRLAVCVAASKRPGEGPAVGKQLLLAYTAAHQDDARGWYFLGKIEVDDLNEPDLAVTYFEKARSLDSACEKTLRELFALYSTARPDEAKAKALDDLIKNGAKARKLELSRRRQKRADGSDGCN